MSSTKEAEFGTLRSLVWPIYRHELRKVVPMLLMLFLITFNYTILRNMKDSLVVTAQSSGAEVIPFIKVWVMLPMALIMTILFIKLTNRFSQERVFYLIITGFLLFFAFFTFVLYPNRDVLHPHTLADSMQAYLPVGFKGLVAMFRNWTFTAFYVMSELWSSIVMTVLFRGFANEVTKVAEAGRFYSVIGVGANLSAIVAGQIGVYFSGITYNPAFPLGRDAWDQTLILLVSAVIIAGLLTMAIFRWMSTQVLTDPSFDEFHHSKLEYKAKRKLSVRESFSFLSDSKYLVCIAVIVVSYNLVINLVEVVWKDQLRNLYPSPGDYNTYMNNVSTIIGVLSTLVAFSMSRLLASFGWTKVALITPVVMLLTSAGFFTFVCFSDYLGGAVVALTGVTPLAIAVFFGSSQNCLSKAAKFSVFDASKEMAFIPLCHESKLKGKAAIDGVGSRLGKSGGSLIHQGLLMLFTTLSMSAPYVAAILMGVIVLWIIAVRILGKLFNELVASQQPEAAAEILIEQPQHTPAIGPAQTA